MAPRRKNRAKKDIRLFIMDAPNVDMALSSLLQHKASHADRPNYRALMVWLKLRTQKHEELGYMVLIKKRQPGDEDVDYAMVMYLRHVRMSHNLVEVIIASNDGWCFLRDLEVLVQEGTRVTILGFEQRPSVLTRHPKFEFIPLPSIPGVMPTPVP